MANNGQYNPFKWDYCNVKTWTYMYLGGVVGGLSGLAGGAIATSGIPMANTLSIAAASLTNSLGTWAYTAGQSHLDLSEILERIFKRLKINDVFLCSYSLHFVYLYLISSDLTNTLAAMIYGKYLSNPFNCPGSSSRQSFDLSH